MFDLAPLQTWHLYFFLGVFLLTFLAVGQRSRRPALGSRVPYAGFIVLAVTTMAAFFLLEDTSLKIGLALAAVVVALVGKTDEIEPLSARAQFIWQLVIVGILVSFGWAIPFVSNPWGSGVIDLSWITLGPLVVPGSILAAGWLLFYMNAINWIDGVDGLAASILVLAHSALIAVSLLPATQDSQTLALAMVGMGALLAFLIWNFPSAQVYLGTTGSWFMGLYTALVAMHGGGKIITTVLVLALPVLDMFFVIAQRLLAGRLPWHGDTTSHLHHRLLSLGITPRHITLAAAVVTAWLVIASLVLPTSMKLIVFGVLVIGFGIAFVRMVGRKQAHNED